MSAFTVSGTVTDSSGNASSWSASATVADATVVTLPDYGTIPAQPGVAFWQKSGAFDGSGATYQQVPMTSTKANVSTGTTPWFGMMFGGGSGSAVATDLDIGNVTYACQAQPGGLWQHGIRIAYSVGAKIHDLTSRGHVGAGSSPPQETHAMPLWNADATVGTDVTLDGRRNPTDPWSAVQSATMLNGTSCDGGTWTRLKATYARYGFAVALFNCSGSWKFTDCDFRWCRKAINLEKSFGGDLTFTRCDFRNLDPDNVIGSTKYCMQASSYGSAANPVSTVVKFIDCLFDADKCIVNTFPSPGSNGTNYQKDSDITRWETVNGTLVKVTDPARFQIVKV